jgi:hypothetical protein
MTATRGYGGGPARGGARERKRSWKYSRVKARRNAWVAPGGAQGPEEGVVTWEQELAAGGSRGGSGDGGAMWRGQERPARAVEAAARAPGSTWHGLKQRGVAGARHMAGEAATARRAEGNQSRAEQ